MRIAVNLLILFCYIDRSVAASHCYPDYCHLSTDLSPVPGYQCVLTNVQRDKDCVDLTFQTSHREAVKEDSDKFSLNAYTFKSSNEKLTAFNLSVTQANFHELITRYQDLSNPNQSTCRHVKLYGNETHPPPKDLYISCPFRNESIESQPYLLDIFISGETYSYGKRYIFNVPRQKSIEEGTSVQNYAPFVYTDVSHEPVISLHIQPLPESYNVSEYRVWLMNNNTDSPMYTSVFSSSSMQEIRYTFTARTGVFYFKVSAIHTDCGEYGCANTTTPSIIIQETPHRLLIMIISTVWIPPVILYALYHIYKLYRRDGLKRRRKPTCLLVYSPTRLTHINAMNELTKYLRNSNVTVIDTLDVTDNTGQDRKDYCGAAFQSADVVLVVASPPSKKPTVSFIYRNNDDHLLKLVKENHSRKEKRYYIVQLPYCKPEDVPEETRHLKRFTLPKELPKLVKAIHKMDISGCVYVSDKDFLDSVKLAKLEMLEEDGNSPKETRETETENLLTAPFEHGKRCPVNSEGKILSQTFSTNIDELNLLGETENSGETTFTRLDKPALQHASADGFRVDQLNL